MRKIVIIASMPETATNCALKLGQHGYITKETELATANYLERCSQHDDFDPTLTRIRFPARQLGYLDAEPIHMWVPSANFKYETT